MKALKMIGLLFIVAVLGGCVYYVNGVDVTMRAPATSIDSGEILSIDADAWSADGSPVTYEWTEDGIRLDATGPTLAYSRFVTVTTSVVIQVTVRTSSGLSASRATTITVSPALSPATLVVSNDSPFVVYYLHVSRSGESDWGPDQMRPSATIPAHTSHSLSGVPAGTWDVMATGVDGSPVWQATVVLSPSEVKNLHLY